MKAPCMNVFTKRYYFPGTSTQGTGNYLLAKGKKTILRESKRD
jgi:hypothetical protein